MPIVDRASRSIDLSNQGDALDAAVLDKVRGALRLNDYFVQLDLSHNALSDESVAMLCAILKDKTYVETLELRDCDLNDKDFSIYLMPAILARNKIRAIDLSKNDGLTDKSVDAICKLIRESDIVMMRLVGTRLSRASGRKIALALEANTTMELCDLPFAVGFDVLDRVSLLLRRNVEHKASLEEARDIRKEMEEMATVAERQARSATSLSVTSPSPKYARRPAAGAGASLVMSPLAGVPTDGTGDDDADGRAAMAAAMVDLGRSRRERVALARYYTTKGRKNAVLLQDAKLPAIGGTHIGRRASRSQQQLGRGSVSTGGYAASRTNQGVASLLAAAGTPSAAAGASPSNAPAQPVSSSAAGSSSWFTANPTANVAAPWSLKGTDAYDVLRDYGSLNVDSFRAATDPAVNRSLHHLRVLDQRCRTVEEYRRAARNDKRQHRGLAPLTLPKH